MTSYKFTSNTKYFTVIDNLLSRRLPLEGLVLVSYVSDNQKVFLSRSTEVKSGAITGFTIDLSVDSVDVDGVTTFANASNLMDALAPIVYANAFTSQTLGYSEPNLTLSDGGSVSVGNFTALSQVVVNQSNYATELTTIDPTKVYYIDGVVDVGGFQIEVPVGGFRAISSDFDTSGIVSDGLQPLFTSPVGGSGNVLLTDLFITGALVFDLTDADGTHTIRINGVNFNDCVLGDVTNYRQLLELGTGRFGGAPELTLHGDMNGYRISTSIARDITIPTALFKAGTGLSFSGRFITDINVDLPTTGALLDFSPVNITNDESLIIDGAFVTRNGVMDSSDTTIYPNINEKSIKSNWGNNTGLPNTTKYIKGAVSTEIETVINTVAVYEVMQGTVTIQKESHFEQVGTGFEYKLLSGNGTYQFTGNFSVNGTANDEYAIRVVKSTDDGVSWTEVNHVTRIINSFAGGRDVGFTSLSFIDTLSKGDRVRLEIENYSGTGNFTIETDSYFIISE